MDQLLLVPGNHSWSWCGYAQLCIRTSKPSHAYGETPTVLGAGSAHTSHLLGHGEGSPAWCRFTDTNKLWLLLILLLQRWTQRPCVPHAPHPPSAWVHLPNTMAGRPQENAIPTWGCAGSCRSLVVPSGSGACKITVKVPRNSNSVDYRGSWMLFCQYILLFFFSG